MAVAVERPNQKETAQAPVSILIVDDHPVVRLSLSHMFSGQPEFEVVGEAANCRELCSKVEDLHPDVVLLDLEMDDSTGSEAVARLRRQKHKGHIVVFSAHDEPWLVLELLKLDVQGYVVKDSPQADLCEAIRVVSHGGMYLDPALAKKIGSQIAGRGPAKGEVERKVLTQRERAVLEQLVAGKRNREIADDLSISERTVKFHVSSILKKLGVRNRTAAVKIAAKLKLLVL